MPKADLTPDDDRPPIPGDLDAGDPDAPEEFGTDYPAGDAPAAVEQLTVDEVAALLAGTGRGLHSLLGDPRVDEHWAFTPAEIDNLAPPLTAIINRRPAVLAVVRQSDAATATLVVAAYLRRNLKLSATIADMDDALADQSDADRVPIVPDDGDRPRDIGDADD